MESVFSRRQILNIGHDLNFISNFRETHCARNFAVGARTDLSHRFHNFLGLREAAERTKHCNEDDRFHSPNVGGSAGMPIASIKQAFFDSGVGVHPAVSQKWPMGPVLVHPRPIDFANHDLFFANRAFGNDLSVWSTNETLSPEFDPIAAGRRFMADSIGCGNVAAIGDRVTALDCFPGIVLGSAEFFLLAWMPANRGWVENYLRAP